MLKVGGIWVSPFEVESALAAHEAVLEAAVVGHADADGLIKPQGVRGARRPARASDDAATELQAFVKAQLAPYKYPRWIEFVDRAAEDGDRQDPALQAARHERSRRAGAARSRRRSASAAARRALVFLHEGLGSVAQWRDFPARVARARRGCAALVYSRRGYGRSAPVALPRPLDYMHDEARASCPRCSTRCGIERCDPRRPQRRRVDRARHAAPTAASACAALVLIAPHVFVEDVSVASIARRATPTSTATCARGSRSTTATSTARSGAGTAPGSIPRSARGTSRSTCPRIDVPVLVIQGEDDPYGTLAQVDAIARQVARPRRRLMMLPRCGHAPHRDQPDATESAMVAFVKSLGLRAG